MSDSVAALGFEISSKPLDDTTAKLKDLSSQAKDTGRAVEEFNQKASRAGADAGNAPKQLAAGLAEAEKAAKLAGTSVGMLDSMAKRAGVSITDMAQRVAAARVGMVGAADAAEKLGAGLNTVAPAAAAVNTAASAAAVGIIRKTSAMSELDKAAQRMGPLLNQFAGGLGAILSISNGVRGGLAGLAAVAGGAAAVGLAKVGDEVARSEKLFAALTGSASNGRAALDKVKETSRATGIETDVLAKALQQIAQGQADFASKNLIYANSSDQAAKATSKNNDVLKVLGTQLRSVGATAEEASSVILTMSGSIGKTGSLTAEAFQKIRDTSLPVADALAQIFGFKGVDAVKQFQDQLEKTPLPVDELVRRLLLVGPAVDTLAKTDGLKTFEQATRELSTEWRNLLETIAQTGAFSAAAGAVSGLASVLRFATTGVSALKAAFGSLPEAAVALGGMTRLPMPDNSGGQSFDESGFGDIQLGGFASGGSFVVGGSGGTDSQVVSFKATPGELVTIQTPDQAASSIASLRPAPETDDDEIKKLFNEQTARIVSAIESLKTAVTSGSTSAATSISPSLRSFGGGVSSDLPLGGGGGGGGTQTPFKKLEDELKKREQELMSRERELGGGGNFAGGSGFSGMARGQAIPIRGGNSSFPILPPSGRFSSALNPSGLVRGDDGVLRLKNVERNTNETTRQVDEANRMLGNVDQGIGLTAQEVASGASETVGAVNASSNTISNAISSIGSMISSAISSLGGGGGGGGGGFDGSGGGVGSSLFDGGYSPGYDGGGSSSFFGNPYDVGGNPFDTGSSGYDTSFGNPFDSGASSPDFNGDWGLGDMGYGAFASGGQFTVGGNGGIDTTPVKFWGTRGETVTVTPAGVAPPSGVRVSSSSLRPGGSGQPQPRTVQHVTHKHVTINVQEGLSSQTILRSRAQIERAM